MKCLHCYRMFDMTEDDMKVSALAEIPFCSWECFRDSEFGLRQHARSLSKKRREAIMKDEAAAKAKVRGFYHVGEAMPKPQSEEAWAQEEAYRERMRKSCAKKPPRLRGASLRMNEGMGSRTLLPSEVFFGKAASRVLDEADLRLGGDDGEKFNFEGE